jgi:hypothetical protein
MTPERYQRLCELFDQAHLLAAAEQAAFVREVAGHEGLAQGGTVRARATSPAPRRAGRGTAWGKFVTCRTAHATPAPGTMHEGEAQHSLRSSLRGLDRSSAGILEMLPDDLREDPGAESTGHFLVREA